MILNRYPCHPGLFSFRVQFLLVAAIPVLPFSVMSFYVDIAALECVFSKQIIQRNVWQFALDVILGYIVDTKDNVLS